jgi:hypothetical protein
MTPRLRRSGVRSPESLLGRPQVTVQSPEPMGSTTVNVVPAASPGAGVDDGLSSLDDDAPSFASAVSSSTPRGPPPAHVE